MKPVESKPNSAGGIDLLTERDAGNSILILTGNPERSLQFWEDLLREAQNNIHRLKISTWMIEDLSEHEEQNDISEQELGSQRKRWISLSYPDLVQEYCDTFPAANREASL
jgi:hypothetical protein|tara:strand:+ start:669 stop:1001 length:333 start_codon:yes stop_codon:yes gene_type:complete